METARYWIALLLVAVSPGIYLYWFSIHPLIRFWRRVGPHWTLALHLGLIAALAAGVFALRDRLLTVEYGTRPALVAAAAVLFAAAVRVRMAIRKELSDKTLTGLPELAPERYGSRLVTGGIYARVRHPRYAQLLLGFLAWSLFANYLAAYAVVLTGIVWALLLVRVEEQELLDRFGEDYERYRRRVPWCFIPGLL